MIGRRSGQLPLPAAHETAPRTRPAAAAPPASHQLQTFSPAQHINCQAGKTCRLAVALVNMPCCAVAQNPAVACCRPLDSLTRPFAPMSVSTNELLTFHSTGLLLSGRLIGHFEYSLLCWSTSPDGCRAARGSCCAGPASPPALLQRPAAVGAPPRPPPPPPPPAPRSHRPVLPAGGEHRQ
jgi:hypothetical protein